MTTEQRLLIVLESIRDELRGIRAEIANFHGEKSEDKNETNKD